MGAEQSRNVPVMVNKAKFYSLPCFSYNWNTGEWHEFNVIRPKHLDNKDDERFMWIRKRRNGYYCLASENDPDALKIRTVLLQDIRIKLHGHSPRGFKFNQEMAEEIFGMNLAALLA